jgi:hypothetical protein
MEESHLNKETIRSEKRTKAYYISRLRIENPDIKGFEIAEKAKTKIFHLQSFPLQLLQSLNLLEGKRNKNFSFLPESGREEMDENLCPIFLSQKSFPFVAGLIKCEVDDIWKEIGQVSSKKRILILSPSISSFEYPKRRSL